MAIIKNREFNISPVQKDTIENCLIEFVNWLKNLHIKNFDHRAIIIFETFAIDDTMRVDSKKNIHFNLEYLKKCSMQYFVALVLHEAYHFYINIIPNKSDATRIKDFYYSQMMLHIDVEADYYVAKFLKEKFNFQLTDYLSLYYSGANTFRDKEVRPVKFERFICSMLTITHLFEYNELAIYRVTPEAIRLYKSKPRAILHKANYSEAKVINLKPKDLDILLNLYRDPDKFIENAYINKLSKILFYAVDGHKKKFIIPKMRFKKNRKSKR